jgi:hypothetical protein
MHFTHKMSKKKSTNEQVSLSTLLGRDKIIETRNKIYKIWKMKHTRKK